MGATYGVTASNLNLRAAAGVESPILSVLRKGTIVEFVEASAVQGWWKVTVPTLQKDGYVARQYLAAVSGSGALALPFVNDVLWRATEVAAGHVSYLLGGKHSSAGSIDCSGWVGEITRQAFDAVNSDASPDIVFHHADYSLFETHSDGIVTAIQARTGTVLHGAEITAQSLRPGMLIGLNFGDYGWEHNRPPRVYGIDHIVQVMANPADGALFVTQSSSSGGGVNKVALDSWLAARSNLIASKRIHAVDPMALADRNTPYLQRLSSQSTPTPTPAQPAAPTANPRLAPFSGRGFYVYSAADLLGSKGYKNVAAVITELKRCRTQNIWVRVNGRGYVGESKGSDGVALTALIAAAKGAGIQVAGWGWCQGEDPAAEAALASRALARFGLDAYVADIEQDVNGAKWIPAEVNAFIATFRSTNAGPLSITSHGFIDWHSPELFDGAAAGGVDCVNPQTYWFDFPNSKMLKSVGAPAGKYALDDPASYVRLCFDRWGRYKLPIVVAGQACPEGDLSLAETEQKLAAFLAGFTPPPGLLGTTYWHFGATSKAMRDAIAAHP